MKRQILILLVLSLSTMACAPAERPAAEGTNNAEGGGASSTSSRPLTIKGSDTMVILGQRFAEEYMKSKPGVTVQVNGGGSGTGIAALINGTVDLAQSSRMMKGKEKAEAEQKRGAPVVEIPVAMDALSVFAHSTNRVQNLSLEQLNGIYTGKILNWKEVGGNSAQIILYGRENSSGTYEYFKEHVLNKADFAPRVQTLQGTAAVINAVSKDVNAIGYGGIAYAKEIKIVPVRKDASSPAIAPSEATVDDGSYPISRKLYFYYLQNPKPELQGFVDWVLSPAGQNVVAGVGYFPLGTAKTPPVVQSASTTGPAR